MLLVMISSLCCIENLLFFIYLLKGLGIILILFKKKLSHDSIHTNLYLLLEEKNEGFFQYPILHIMVFEALIEGYGRSKSYIKLSLQ